MVKSLLSLNNTTRKQTEKIMILTTRKARGSGSNVTEVLLVGKNVRIKKYYENKENHSWIKTVMKYNLISRLRSPKAYKVSTRRSKLQ